MRTPDSEPSAVPSELEASAEIRAVIEEGARLAGELMSTLEGAKLAWASLATSLLWEYMVRLDWRWRDLLGAAKELSTAAWDEERLVLTRQLQFVDRTESFHRQLYGTLSVLMLLLSHAAPRRVASHLPISSVQAFLAYLREQPELSSYTLQLDQLCSSVEFRATFLDHPQQTKLHHWMTMGTPSETVIIYYVPVYVAPVDNSAVDVTTGSHQYLNPRAPNFRPAIVCSSFQVSPEPQKTQTALCSLVHGVLGWCREMDRQRDGATQPLQRIAAPVKPLAWQASRQAATC